MTQSKLRTFHNEVYETDRHLAILRFASGKWDVTVLIQNGRPNCTFGNSFKTIGEAKAWVNQLQDES